MTTTDQTAIVPVEGDGFGTKDTLAKEKRRLSLDRVLLALRECDGLIKPAAEVLGCGRRTIYRWRDKYPEVQQAIDDSREDLIDDAESALARKIRAEDLGAICFFLKTQGKKRGYVERQETSGPDGEPMKIVIEYADTTPENP
jgi:hypothetical protein